MTPLPLLPLPLPLPQVVLGDLDAGLASKGMAPLNAQERAVAVRKLMSATGTRGMGFALDAAMEEVLSFRAGRRA